MSRARRLGPYTPLSAFYADDEAVASLEDAGDMLSELLFLRALADCAKEPAREGRVLKSRVLSGRLYRRPRAALVKAAGVLVELGLWVDDGDAWCICSWLKWNRSQGEIDEARAADARRKRTGPRDQSERIPDGFQTESERSPDGESPDSLNAPARAFTAVHDTTRHDTTPQPPRATSTGNDLVRDHANALKCPPPRKVQAQVSQQVEALLAEDIAPKHVAAGLSLLRKRPDFGPAMLPNLVNQAMNAPPKLTDIPPGDRWMVTTG